ncbi:hypothetical protein OC844_005974 [Tilletia horrida]|nr:hypothetical protein OC844_005974 [Tilletia horrida]
MNTTHRTARLPLASRQAVRIVGSSSSRSSSGGGGAGSSYFADEDDRRHRLEFDADILPTTPFQKASKSKKLTSLDHIRRAAADARRDSDTDDDGGEEERVSRTRSRSASVASRAPSRTRRRSRSASAVPDVSAAGTAPAGGSNFPLKRISDPYILIPPTIPPPQPPQDSLLAPPRRPRPHINAGRNLVEFHRAHPDLASQLSDTFLYPILEEQETRDLSEYFCRHRQGDVGPEGVEEMRRPLIGGTSSLTAAWDEDGKSVLLLTAGDENLSQLYLHELRYAPRHGIVKTVHAQPLLSGPERILQVSICTRPEPSSSYRSPSYPPLLTAVRTAHATNIWDILAYSPLDILEMSTATSRSSVSGTFVTMSQMRRKRKFEARAKLNLALGMHPFQMVRVQSVPTYPLNYNPPARQPQATQSTRSAKSKGKARALDDLIGEAGIEERTSLTATSRPPVVHTAWHPRDSAQLLTVDAVGRIGIWAYDPGIRIGRHHLVGNAQEQGVTFPVAPEQLPAEGESAFFHVQWAQRPGVAFLASRSRLSIVNLETGFSAVIMDLSVAPRMSSVMSRPQFVDILASHSDSFNAKKPRRYGKDSSTNNSSGDPARPELLAAVTTVDLFVWDISALEHFLTDAEKSAAAAAAAEAAQGRKGKAKAMSSSSIRSPPKPLPQVWWEHVRGQDRSLRLRWIPLEPGDAAFSSVNVRSVLLSSARSRLLVCYTVERIVSEPSRRPEKRGIAVAGDDLDTDMEDEDEEGGEDESHAREVAGTAETRAALVGVSLRALPPTTIDSGLPTPKGSDLKRLIGAPELPRSTNAPLFLHFDSTARAPSNATKRPNGAGDDQAVPRQLVMLEQDARMSIVGTICETNLPSVHLRSSRLAAARQPEAVQAEEEPWEDEEADSEEQDMEDVEGLLQIKPMSVGRRALTKQKNADARRQARSGSTGPGATGRRRGLRFADSVPLSALSDPIIGPLAVDYGRTLSESAANAAQGERRLWELNGSRPVAPRDEQRDRSILDLRGLYKAALMQSSIIDAPHRIIDVEDVLVAAMKRIQIGDLLDAVVQLPQSFINSAQEAALTLDLDLLGLTSPALGGTMSIPATMLMASPDLQAVLDQLMSTLSQDLYGFRTYQPQRYIDGRNAHIEEIEEDEADDGVQRTASVARWKKLADGIREVYLGPESRRSLHSATFTGVAADQLALDLLLSSRAVSSRQVSIVTHHQGSSTVPARGGARYVHDEEDGEMRYRSGIERVLHRVVRDAGHPAERLNDSDEEDDEAGPSQSQSQQRQSQRSASRASSQASGRIGTLEDRVDRHLDEVERRWLPEVELPFLRPYLREEGSIRGRTRGRPSKSTQKKKTKKDSGKAEAEAEGDAKMPTFSRAARLLLADWTIGERVEIAHYRNPYDAAPDLDEIERERRQRRATSSQPPPLSHPGHGRHHSLSLGLQTPSRGGTATPTPRAHTPVNPVVERWRGSSIAPGAGAGAASGAFSPGSGGLSSQGAGAGNGGSFPFGFGSQPGMMMAAPPILAAPGPPRIASSRSELHFASQAPESSQPALSGLGLGSGQQHSHHHHLEHGGGDGAGSSQQVGSASTYQLGPMAGSSQDTAEGMASTQPLPGRYADRRTAAPQTPSKKKAKKKRAGGF